MSDERLSDISVLAIERHFEIDFEKVVDVFAKQHKNCRIMLIMSNLTMKLIWNNNVIILTYILSINSS